MIMKILFKVTGGRPMRRVETLFIDVVSGESVGLYVDSFGRHWMATNSWGMFRVKKEPRP